MNTIKKIQVDGVDYDIQARELTKVTYAELKEMRNNSGLTAGHLYRITDYEFTTVQSSTKSAGNVFDIIVLATTENQLSELARAIQHEGDTYFDGNDLGAWELWYDLDNDTDKYEWADAENGKGVIYRMIDEKRNDCPYDFKNALFYNIKLASFIISNGYYYTFSYVVGGKLYEGTVEKQVKNCYGNSMGVYLRSNKKALNLNVLRNTTFGDNCYSNTFGNNCYSNTFGNNCYSNTFGYNCFSNTFWNNCFSNTFWNNCDSNTFGNSCYFNTFGNGCDSNTFGDNCNSNTFGDSCYSNTFGNNCYSNTFGDNCNSNTFGNSCYYNTFGDNCRYRNLDVNKTSTTLNDEYFDDGSGQLVPIKHPDLSTQPSILPYKFMGNYVYEQLIPIGEADSFKDLTSMDIDITSVVGSNTVILSLSGFANVKVVNSYSLESRVVGVPLKAKSLYANESLSYLGIYVESELILGGDAIITYGKVVSAYVRVVYTSMPEEGGDYYGYNNY